MSHLRVYRHALRVGREDFRVFYANWKVWLLAQGGRSIFAAATIALLGKLLGSNEQVFYLLIGNAVIVGAHSAAWGLQASTWDRWDGTYPFLVVSPMGLRPSVTGRSSIWVFGGAITAITTFIALTLMFGMPVPFPAALLVPAVLTIICTAAYAFSLGLGAVVVRVPRVRNILHGLAMTTLASFTGANVPVTFWPSWVQSIAAVLPITHGLRALRALLAHGPVTVIVEGLVLEVVVAGGWLAVAWLTMNAMANAGRADGSIDFAGL